MQLSELKRRTKVYETRLFSTAPLSWLRGEVIPVYRGESGKWSLAKGPDLTLVGIARAPHSWGVMTADELPAEFFNHQLLEYDASSDSSVTEFVRNWGLPFLPQRNMSPKLANQTAQDLNRIEEAITATAEVQDLVLILDEKWEDEYFRLMRENTIEDAESGESNLMPFDDPVYGEEIPAGPEAELYRSLARLRGRLPDAISIKEASLALSTLQTASLALTHAVRSGTCADIEHFDVINMGAANPRVVRRGEPGGDSWDLRRATPQQSLSMLTAAICNQIVDAIADPAPWRACACEGCKVVFKRKQSKSAAPSSDSAYCCSACEERQKKRNQRAAAKNRVKH